MISTHFKDQERYGCGDVVNDANASGRLSLGLIQGDHHQDGEADGRAGGHGHGHARLAALPAEDHEPNPTGESREQLEEPSEGS